MGEFKRYFTKKIMRILLFPFRIFSIKQKQIFIINDLGYNYSCNPKTITEFLLNECGNEFKIIYNTIM